MSIYDNILEKLSIDDHWSTKNEAALLEPFTYISSAPGKEIRTLMIQAFNTWLNVPAEQLGIIAKLVNMMHSASLLVDDIQDNSLLRRGKPVAHKVYGIPQTINTAYYVLFLACKDIIPSLKHTTNNPSKDLETILTDELVSLHRGQGLDILWRDTLQCPSEEEYIFMANGKAGAMLRVAIRLMMACGTTNIDVNYVPLVNLLGLFGQIRDDLMNLQSAEYTSKKGFADDLTEGKFSFPVIHAIHADTSNREVLNVLQQRPSTPTLKIYTIDYLKNHTKSFDYTLSVLDSLETQMRWEIRRLGGNQGLEQLMDMLHVDASKLS